jgi:hypothetical protein
LSARPFAALAEGLPAAEVLRGPGCSGRVAWATGATDARVRH